MLLQKRRLWIVTGGQAGVDRAAMDVALSKKLPLRGWCPQGRAAEDGEIAAKYPLQECSSEDPALRTELNVIDSDATLIITEDSPQDGTPLTEECCTHYQRPFYSIDLFKDLENDTISEFNRWIEANNVRILNIAGPRESHRPGKVYSCARSILELLL